MSITKLERLLADVQAEREYVTEVLKKLVSVPTINPPGENYEKALELVGTELGSFGYDNEFIETPESYVVSHGGDIFGLRGKRVNLVSKRGGSTPRLILNAHIDTVPAGLGWTVDPFGGKVEDGKIYGRGAADDKSGVAILVLVAKLMRKFQLDREVVFAVTVDEEVGGEAGLGYLVKTHKLIGQYCLSADSYADFITAYHNGVFRFQIIVEGKSAHGSLPFEGVNAIEKASKIVLSLQEYQKSLLKRASSYDASPDLIEKGFHKLFPTANVGTIRGGSKSNIVPDQCVIEAERRFVPGERVADVKKEISDLLENVKRLDPGLKYTIKEIATRDTALTDPENPFVKKIRDITGLVYGCPLPVCGMTGATDMSYTTNILGIPSVALGAMRHDENIHSADEFVRIDDVLKVAAVFCIAAGSLP